MELITSTSDFFMQVVTGALRKHDVRLQDATCSYLVNLLTEQTVARVDDEPLALKLVQADQSEPLDRVRLLKETGDTALYVSGFFAESLSHRQLSVEYYVDLGGIAYRKLVSTGRLVSELVRGVFDELAAQFARLVNVLAEARSDLNIHSTTNGLRLYEQWRASPTEHLAQRLRGAGFLLPVPGKIN